MFENLARLDRLIADTEGRIVVQAGRLEAARGQARRLDCARRRLIALRLDLDVYRISRRAIAESRRLMRP